MISDKINNLFNFIEFLHSNIDNFKQYDEVIKELNLLLSHKSQLNPEKNFKDKLKNDKLSNEIKPKYKIVHDNIIDVIEKKAESLEISDDTEFLNVKSFNHSEINSFKKNFVENDVPIVLDYKRKYIEFRKKTNCTYFKSFFFGDLDKILKNLFEYFNEGKENEFEQFETQAIEVQNINEANVLGQKGFEKFNLPNNFLNIKKEQSNISVANDLEKDQIFNELIFDLTLKNLSKYGLKNQQTKELLNTKGNFSLQCDEGNFFVSRPENKVYTGIEFYRKTYFGTGLLRFPFNCPDLVPEYFDLALNIFKEKQKKNLGKLYSEVEQYNNFITNEIEEIKKYIATTKEFLAKNKYYAFDDKEKHVEICEAYIQYLKRKINNSKQLQQSIAENHNEELLKNEYIKIFKNDLGFTLFSKMFELYKGEKTHLANFSFLYYAMEKDFLVCSRVEFIEFLSNEKYDINLDKIDSRQSGSNKKSKLYNSIKYQLQIRHK